MAALSGADTLTAKSLTIDASVPRMGKEKKFTQMMLNAQPNGWTPVFKGERGAALALVTARTRPDMAQFARDKASLTANFKNQAGNRYYQEWMKKMKESKKVVDNRYRVFPYCVKPEPKKHDEKKAK
jgi:hypothetical protein